MEFILFRCARKPHLKASGRRKKKKTPRRNVCLKRKEAPLGVFTYDWMPRLDINQRRVFDKPRTCKAGVRQITRTPDTHKDKERVWSSRQLRAALKAHCASAAEFFLLLFFLPCWQTEIWSEIKKKKKSGARQRSFDFFFPPLDEKQVPETAC